MVNREILSLSFAQNGLQRDCDFDMQLGYIPNWRGYLGKFLKTKTILLALEGLRSCLALWGWDLGCGGGQSVCSLPRLLSVGGFTSPPAPWSLVCFHG